MENSSKKKYYLDNRYEILSKKKKKNDQLTANQKRIISFRNKRKYKSLSDNQKKVLSKSNKEKYRDMSDEKRITLKEKNRRKHLMLTAADKIKLKYKNMMYYRRNSNKILDRISSRSVDLLKLINVYIESIKDGPTEICECCGGLFFKRSMKSISKNLLQTLFDDDGILQLLCVPSMVSFRFLEILL